MSSSEQSPYNEIFADLLRSVMLAQADVALALKACPLASIPDILINRYFAWLTLAFDEGENRHLFDGSSDTHPLRIKGLRYRANLPADIRDLLERREPLPFVGDPNNDPSLFVQAFPTRISRLLKTSFASAVGQDQDQRDSLDASAVVIKSPLAVVYDYLTAPSMPASRAYALLPTRNFVFETFGIFPSEVGLVEPSGTFSIADIEEALSFIWTSLRPRY